MRNIDQIETHNIQSGKINMKAMFLGAVSLMLLITPVATNASNEVLPIIGETTQTGNYTLTGVIKEANGEPVIGASVVVKGTTIGAMTDMDGKFSLSVPRNGLLVVSYIGFTTQEIQLNGQNNLNITLKEDTKLLDEVVVVGYGSMKKSEVTTAIVSVKPAEFNMGGNRDPISLLEGRVAGLTVTRTNGINPNSSSAMQLRGVTSLTGNTSPLVVVDGIPGGNLDLIQPDDIESFEVLKDGSAAAIYGSKANAGVILITTKGGKAGKTQVEYSGYVTHHTLARSPQFLTAEEFRTYKNDPSNPKGGQMQDFGYDTDWFDEIINKGNVSHYHNVSITGGNENANFRASLYYNDLQGIRVENSRENFGGRVSANAKGWDNMLSFQMDLSTNFNKAKLLGDQFEEANTRNPTAPIYNEDGTYNELTTRTNPVGYYKQRYNNRDQQTSSANFKFGLTPIKDLTISAFGSILRNNEMDNEYVQREAIQSERDWEGGGKARKKSFLKTNYAFEPTIDYNILIKNTHSLNAIVGYSYQYIVEESMESENFGFVNNSMETNNLEGGSWLRRGDANMKSDKKDEKLISFFGRINYSYQGKYVAQVSLRREGSSKFGDNHKWGNFPSFSVAWNATNEDFMQSIEYLSLLKVRAGYGITGTLPNDPYRSKVTLGIGDHYIQDGVWLQTYGPSRNPNPELRWEKKKEWNLGVDFGFFNNRLGGTIDLYQRNIVDLLENYTAQLPPFIHSGLYTNVGTLTSKGIEVTINTTPYSGKHVTWRSDFIFSHNYNKLKSFSDDVYSIEYKNYGEIGGNGSLGHAIRTYEGDRIGNFYGKRFAGLTEDGKWLFYKEDGSKVSPDKITAEDLGVIGNGVPKFYAAWNNYVKYKDFDISVSLKGKFGFQVLNRMDMQYGNKINIPNNVLKSAITTHDRIDDSIQYSDYYLENGNFVKLDNITIGYNFSKNIDPKVPKFRVYLTMRDLATITKYSGVNPEVEDTGLNPGLESRNPYPTTRSFTLGLNVSF